VVDPSPRDRQTVVNYLAYLDRAWSEDIEDEEIARSSNVLRVLLVDDWYPRAWRAAGHSGEPSVRAVDLEAILADRELDDDQFLQAGGGVSFGTNVRAWTERKGRAFTEEEIRADYERVMEAMSSGPDPLDRSYTLTAYLASPSVYARGRFVSRREVVRYMAHRLGGTHLGRSGHKEEELFDLLDGLSDVWQVADRPAIYYEALSIGQSVGQSDDARLLRHGLSARRIQSA
jgi:hypothetical protein